MAKNEVAEVSKFSIVTGMEDMDEELRAEMEDEMNDLDSDGGIECKHIKVPSGGGNAFNIEADDPNDPDVAKTIEGVIIFTHRMNAYWKNAFGEGGGDNSAQAKIPDCASMDATQGLERETGEIKACDTCPYNQFGTDARGRGKACKNMRRLYIIMSGKPDLYLLTVPPTSIKDVNKQLRVIMSKQKIPYTRMVVKFSLEVTKNVDGTAYSKIKVEPKEPLDEKNYLLTCTMRKKIKEQYEKVGITDEDYETTPVENSTAVEGTAAEAAGEPAGPDGFMNVPESAAKELPFE